MKYLACLLVPVAVSVVTPAAAQSSMTPADAATSGPRAAPVTFTAPAERIASPGLIVGGVALTLVSTGQLVIGTGLFVSGMTGAGCTSENGHGCGPTAFAALGGAIGGPAIPAVVVGIWMIARGARRVPAHEEQDVALRPFVAPSPGGAALGVRF